jgi:metal-responsive CopG/Arc/MetJ family transcriptional regulator
MAQKPKPDAMPVPINMPRALLDKIEEAAALTGLSRQDVIRLAVRIGLEDLRRCNFDIAGAIVDKAKGEASNVTYAKFADETYPDAKVAEE